MPIGLDKLNTLYQLKDAKLMCFRALFGSKGIKIKDIGDENVTLLAIILDLTSTIIDNLEREEKN